VAACTAETEKKLKTIFQTKPMQFPSVRRIIFLLIEPLNWKVREAKNPLKINRVTSDWMFTSYAAARRHSTIASRQRITTNVSNFLV
jgi:hypothetical protein